jgi:hypothetical protein
VATSDLEIKNCSSGELVLATLKDQLDINNVADFEDRWLPEFLRHAAAIRAKLEADAEYSEERFQHELELNNLADMDWSWREYAQRTQNAQRWAGYAVEHGDCTQGLMLVELDAKVARIDPKEGKYVLYIEGLAVAPWNRVPPCNSKGYSGIGPGLILVAIHESRERGYEGRIGLHSLPGAETFYADKLKMTNFGPDEDVDDLPYFELSEYLVNDLLK